MIEGTEPFVDDACAALVQWLTTRTLEGRAQWEMHPNGLISHLAGSMFAQFITHATPQGQVWRLFRVRDNNGELPVRLHPPPRPTRLRSLSPSKRSSSPSFGLARSSFTEAAHGTVHS